MRLSAILMSVLTVCVAMVGCQGGPQAGPSQPVSVLEEFHGSNESLQRPSVQLIHTQEQFETLGIELDRSIDFDQRSLLLVSLGQRPTAGHWVDIDGLQRRDQVLYVQATVNRPGPDEAAAQALTYPYAAALLPKIVGIREIQPEFNSVEGMEMGATEPQPMEDTAVEEVPAE